MLFRSPNQPGPMLHGPLAGRTGTNARHWSRFVWEPGLMTFSGFPKDHFSTSVTNMSRTITQAVASKFDEFKEQLSKDLGIILPRHVQPLGMQTEKLMPMENNRLLNLPSNIHMPGASANVIHPHVALNTNQGGRTYASSSANDFVSSPATPIVTTSAPQNFRYNNRSVVLNSNLQQPFYQTVAYNTPLLQPVGTWVPYGPVHDSYFSGSPLQISNAQNSLPEFPPDRKSTRLNSSHSGESRMPSSA